MVPRICSWIASTISSSTVWVRDGASVSERVASQLPSANAPIRPHVTATVSLIGTGPMEKSVVVESGERITAYVPHRSTAVRAAKMPALAASKGNAPK